MKAQERFQLGRTSLTQEPQLSLIEKVTRPGGQPLYQYRTHFLGEHGHASGGEATVRPLRQGLSLVTPVNTSSAVIL